MLAGKPEEGLLAAAVPEALPAPCHVNRFFHATGTHGNSGLLCLGLELLEAICEHLPLRDRVALACCCRALWARPDALASPALWGRLVLRQRHLASPHKRQSLLVWLGHRRAALRLLELEGHGMGVAVMGLLGSLGASPLCDLRLPYQFAPRAGAEALGRPLEWCTALTRLQLSGNGLRRLPRQVSALQRLAALELGGNDLGGTGALMPLQHLAGGLTRLGLAGCGLRQLPQVLAGLTGLRDLDVSGHEFGGGGEGALSILRALTRLTALDLSECTLPQPPGLPKELSCLGALQSLDIAQSLDLAVDFSDPVEAEAATQPLAHLTALTRLDLSECGLPFLPPQLSALRSLAFLNLRSNWTLGRRSEGDAGAAAFEQLAALAALTRLVLGSCCLRRLPPQLSACTALECLEVGCNVLEVQQDGALPPLRHLTALKHLDLGECSLPAPPTELSHLSALESLELGSNFDMDPECGQLSWEPLRPLSSLTYLHMGWCQQQLQRLPSTLSSLRLIDLDLSGNILGSEAFSLPGEEDGSSIVGIGSLPGRVSAASGTGGEGAQLTALTRLAMGHCSLHRLPLQLGYLARLVDLDVSGNVGVLGPGEAALPLVRLPGLTRLDARRCGMQRVPPAFSTLTSLMELDLGLNPLASDEVAEDHVDEGGTEAGGGSCGKGGGEGGRGGPLEGLQCLRSLRHLSICECGLRRPPPQLAALAALQRLRLSSNPLLQGGDSECAPLHLLRLLAPLPALSYVDVGGCGLRGELGPLSALTALGVNVRC